MLLWQCCILRNIISNERLSITHFISIFSFFAKYEHSGRTTAPFHVCYFIVRVVLLKVVEIPRLEWCFYICMRVAFSEGWCYRIQLNKREKFQFEKKVECGK